MMRRITVAVLKTHGAYNFCSAVSWRGFTSQAVSSIKNNIWTKSRATLIGVGGSHAIGALLTGSQEAQKDRNCAPKVRRSALHTPSHHHDRIAHFGTFCVPGNAQARGLQPQVPGTAASGPWSCSPKPLGLQPQAPGAAAPGPWGCSPRPLELQPQAP